MKQQVRISTHGWKDEGKRKTTEQLLQICALQMSSLVTTRLNCFRLDQSWEWCRVSTANSCSNTDGIRWIDQLKKTTGNHSERIRFGENFVLVNRFHLTNSSDPDNPNEINQLWTSTIFVMPSDSISLPFSQVRSANPSSVTIEKSQTTHLTAQWIDLHIDLYREKNVGDQDWVRWRRSSFPQSSMSDGWMNESPWKDLIKNEQHSLSQSSEHRVSFTRWQFTGDRGTTVQSEKIRGE